MAEDINVVVLGGCGFLGQHVVAELLAEKGKMKTEPPEGGDDSKRWQIKDIKVLDVKRFSEDCLTSQRDDAKTVDYQQCDIRNFDKLNENLKGATAVINCAAVAPDFLREDLGCGDHMQQVNVMGVKNVVKACQEQGIRALIHTSTVSVKMGGRKLIEHTESLTPEVKEEELILGDYAKGRLKAEKFVLDAHGTKSKDGVTLRTVALRPPLIYGEGDLSYVPLIHKLAKVDGYRLPSIGNPDAFLQAAYAGNVAVAHICALKHLINDEEDSGLQVCGGLPVYVTDDTPPNNITALTEPFLCHIGYAPPQKTPYWITSLYIYWAHISNSFKSAIGLKSEEKAEASVPTWALHRMAGSLAVVSRMRAELCMGYTPPYSWEQALKRSNAYYTRKLC